MARDDYDVDLGSYRIRHCLVVGGVTVYSQVKETPESRWAASIRTPSGERWSLYYSKSFLGREHGHGMGRRVLEASQLLRVIALTKPELAKSLLLELDRSHLPLSPVFMQRIHEELTSDAEGDEPRK
jgi:hypothetical protein